MQLRHSDTAAPATPPATHVTVAAAQLWVDFNKCTRRLLVPPAVQVSQASSGAQLGSSDGIGLRVAGQQCGRALMHQLLLLLLTFATAFYRYAHTVQCSKQQHADMHPAAISSTLQHSTMRAFTADHARSRTLVPGVCSALLT